MTTKEKEKREYTYAYVFMCMSIYMALCVYMFEHVRWLMSLCV